MKKILSLLVFAIAFNSANAQTAQETIDWLISKNTLWKFSATSNIIKERTSDVEFTTEYIKVTQGDKYTKLNWRNLKEIVKVDGDHVRLVDYAIKNGNENYFIELYIVANYEGERLKKALTNLATINNAKLLKEDLFKD